VATAGALLTPGIVRSVWWWDPDVAVTYNNVTLWELDPVEVRSRPKPVAAVPPLGQPEQDAFTLAGVSPTALRNWMAANDVALIVSHNLTTRDGDDKQQPFNLRVKQHNGTLGAITTATSYLPGTSHLYDVTHLELFQADQLRGLGGTVAPKPGRRPLARHLHDNAALNPPNTNPSAPSGAVELATDGSMAAFVPAHRALSWQLSDDTFTPVVHERYWLTFQPGEIRVCTSCHGMSHFDQAGHAAPNNLPQALRTLLEYWKIQHPAAPGAPGFYSITPCRVLDSRLADGAGGGPPLAHQGTRLYRFANRCALPAAAKAVSINVTVTQPAAGGFLLLYPGDSNAPLTSTLNFSAGQTRTNNAILSLSADGVGTLKIQNGSPGAAQVIVAVNGYFQ
jgi:hypothetical protein